MSTYKIKGTFEVTIEADSHEEAEEKGIDCFDWRHAISCEHADIEVLEMSKEKRQSL